MQVLCTSKKAKTTPKVGRPNDCHVHKPHLASQGNFTFSLSFPFVFHHSVMTSVPLSTSEAATVDKDPRASELPADLNIPNNYVDYTLKNTKPLPPVTLNNWWKELNYLSLSILTITPTIALYGAFTTKLRWETAIFATFYYFITGFG